MNEDVRVAVLIEKDDMYLLVQEATSVIYGLWNWQQGKVKVGEDLASAAQREAKEETGLDVKLIRKLTVIENPFSGTKETHVYLGEVVGGTLSFSKEEILDVKWFSKAEIMEMKEQLSGTWLSEVLKLLK